MNARNAADFLRAFGDGTRLRIIQVIAQRRLSVGQLARVLRCPRMRVSRHLAYLRARGVVDWERKANAVLYSLSVPGDEGTRLVLSAVRALLQGIEETPRDRRCLQRLSKADSAAGRRGRIE